MLILASHKQHLKFWGEAVDGRWWVCVCVCIGGMTSNQVCSGRFQGG